MDAPGLAAVLSLVVPLAAALCAIIIRRPAVVVGLAVPAMLVLVGLVVAEIARRGPLRVAVGGWEAPLGIELVADGLAGAFLATTALVMAAVSLVALSGFSGRGRGRETRAADAFWPLAFLAWTALNAGFLSGDLFNIYVALELLTLAALALVALDGGPGPVTAALRYAMFSLFGALAYLAGAALIYAGHGTLDIGLLAAGAFDDPASLVAAALMTAGLAAKTALFPFHGWLPPAHSGAPAPASAILSALVPKLSFFILVRLWFDVMPQSAGPLLIELLGALGAAAILYGSILAIRQRRLKLLIAYSTVAQLGYLFLIFPLAGGDGAMQPWGAGAWTGTMFQALSHAAAKAAMFLAAGLVVEAVGHDRFDALNGLARTMPMTAFAFGLASLSLIGLPPSGGFIAKYLLLTAAFASGQIVWAAVMIAGGFLAAVYLFRPLSRTFAKAGAPADRQAVPRLRQALPLALAGASVLIGLVSAPPYDFLQIGRPVAAEEGLE